MINTLIGTWHIQYSNFPMWQKEGMANVNFNYAKPKDKDKEGMDDEVKYIEGAKARSVKGFDTPHKDAVNKFKWRGAGLLKILSSEWRIEWVNPAKDCAIISFEKTLYSPAGTDIMTREQFPPEALIKEAMDEIKRKGHADAEKPLKKVVQK